MSTRPGPSAAVLLAVPLGEARGAKGIVDNKSGGGSARASEFAAYIAAEIGTWPRW